MSCHGEQRLASVLVTLNLLAFSFHTVCDIADSLWRSAREKLATRRRFFNNLASITTYAIFDSWQDLLETLAFARERSTRRRRITMRRCRLQRSDPPPPNFSQCGHRSSLFAIAAANSRRIAIEFGTWCYGRIGGASGAITRGRFFDWSGGMWS
jgi:hypothetical protein